MQRWLAVGMFGLAALRLPADTVSVLPFLNKTPSRGESRLIGESVAEDRARTLGMTGVIRLTAMKRRTPTSASACARASAHRSLRS